jgi:hypothetical protein
MKIKKSEFTMQRMNQPGRYGFLKKLTAEKGDSSKQIRLHMKK